jgi:hypothetical protein
MYDDDVVLIPVESPMLIPESPPLMAGTGTGSAEFLVLPMVPPKKGAWTDLGPPQPLNVFIEHIPGPGGTVQTAIARVWTLDDARRCTLCEECTATQGRQGRMALCLKIVQGLVPDDKAPLFRCRLDPVAGADRRVGTAAR